MKVRQHSTTGNHDTPPRAKRIEKMKRLTCLSSTTHAVTLSLRRAQSFSLVVVLPPRENLVLTSRIPHGGPPTLALLCLNLGTDGGDCGRHLAKFRLARCCGPFQLHRAKPSTSSFFVNETTLRKLSRHPVKIQGGTGSAVFTVLSGTAKKQEK